MGFLRILSGFIPALVSYGGYGASEHQLLALLMIVGLVASLATLVQTNFGLAILIFSMLLSPELEIFKVPAKSVVIRVDDFLIGAVFLTWLAKMAIFKEVALFQRTPLNRPIITYLLVCLFSTLLGFMTGSVKSASSFFFILKYVEYFLIFFMFVNNLRDRRQVDHFMTCFLATALQVCLLSLSQYGKTERLGSPFEGKNPEPASLGGYLLIMIAFMLGLFSYPEWPRHRVIILPLLGLFGTVLLLSISRGAFIAFGPLYLTAILFSRRRGYLTFLLVLAVTIGVTLVPANVVKFTREAFVGKSYEIGGHEFEIGASGVERFENWKYVLELWKRQPFVGRGVTGVGIVDNQFIRVLGETGIVGILAFVWLLLTIFRVGFTALKNPGNFSKALGLALICATVGLLGQGLTANSFIIVRIMEPFWFLAAVTVGVSALETPEAEVVQKEGR